MSGREQGYVQQVFDSNWIAPLGQQVDALAPRFPKSEAQGIIGLPLHNRSAKRT
jgi:hypothetical protein